MSLATLSRDEIRKRVEELPPMLSTEDVISLVEREREDQAIRTQGILAKDGWSLVQKNLRLNKVVKVLIEEGDTLSALRKILSPFADELGWVHGRNVEESWAWEEQRTFNESVLYQALGKDNTRLVLGVWRRLREVCELLTVKER